MMGAQGWWKRLHVRIMLGVAVVVLVNVWYLEYAMRRTLNAELPRVELQSLEALNTIVAAEVGAAWARSGRLATMALPPAGAIGVRVYDANGTLVQGDGPIPAAHTGTLVRRALGARVSASSVAKQGGTRYGVVVTPIVHGGRLVGAVETAQTLPPIEGIRTRLQSELAAASVVALASLVAFGVYLGQRFRAWLADVRRQTEAIARGEFERRITVRSNDEIGEVGACLNRMAEDLDQLAKARNQFLGKVSHELRTPLTIAKGFTSLLAAGSLPPEQQRTVQVIDKQIDDLTRLVNDLLDLSRRRSTELAVAAEPLDMAAFVARIEEQQRPVLRQQHIVLRVERRGSTAWVDGDRQRLEQAVTNLLGNAARYCRGAIEIRYTAEQQHVCIAVCDNGLGIAPEDRARIFEPFFQSRHGPSGRAGLGLTVARELVLAHGGMLEVESRPGEGTTFTIRLPRSAPPKAATGCPRLRNIGQHSAPAQPRPARRGPVPVAVAVQRAGSKR